MLKNSQWVRLFMAAGLYLLLMWGYLVLPSAQWFAAYLALMMIAMLVFWVSTGIAAQKSSAAATDLNPRWREGLLSRDECGAHLADDVLGGFDMDEQMDTARDTDTAPLDHGLAASVLRLDALKAELKLQYAQFGRDQAMLNSKGLGSWHGKRKPRDQ